jgi:hypothetical protein
VYAKVITVSGASVITGDITDIAPAVWGDTATYGARTKGKDLKDIKAKVTALG